MSHQEVWRNGIKLVSATEIQTVTSKIFLDKWRLKLCHCKTHINDEKAKIKPKELEAIGHLGTGHCGFVYADWVKDDAATLGNEVHEIIEEWFNRGEYTYKTPEAVIWADKIIELYKQHNVKPYLIIPEGNMLDEDSNFCGSPDTIATWDGKPEILDTKIKNSLDIFTPVQGWAYRYLLRRKKNVDIKWMRAIWCKKETVSKIVDSVLFDLDEWTDVFKAHVTIWNVMHPKRKVNLLEVK